MANNIINNILKNIVMELEKRELLLKTGNSYTGWGYFAPFDNFIPHGCGKKLYEGYYEFGNFSHGILNGPAIVSFGDRMVTQHFVNGKGTGWGLCMANGGLSNFGYYENGELQYNYTDLVYWYFNKMSRMYNGANMLNMYSSKETHQVTVLWIGFTGGFIEPIKMGARFMPDGSVWIGDSEKMEPTGFLMHFCSNGQIDVGTFEKGELVNRLSMYDYVHNWQFPLIPEEELELFHIPEIVIGHNYFEGFPESMIDTSDKNSTFMRYHVKEIDLHANGNFQSIEDECWEIGDKFIKTNHGNLEIIDATHVDNGQLVGIRFNVWGSLTLNDFSCSKGYESDAEVRTIAFLRQPHNAWVWTYVFDEDGNAIVNLCGYDDLDGMANFIPKLSGLYDLKKHEK